MTLEKFNEIMGLLDKVEAIWMDIDKQLDNM